MSLAGSMFWRATCPELSRSSNRIRRRPVAGRWQVELLEARTLLCGSSPGGLATALPIDLTQAIADSISVPAEVDIFEFTLAESGRLTVHTRSEASVALDTRTSLLRPDGEQLIQSDGESAANRDDLITQHLLPGTYLLAVEGTDGGTGRYTLTTEFLSATPPDEPLLVRFDRDYPYSLMPIYHVTGDFNADGHLDVATGNTFTNDVSVLLGLGDGSFQAARNFAVGFIPFGIVAEDFNRDGRLDLATANQLSNDVSVLLNSGDGTSSGELFSPAVSSPGGRSAWGLAAGDFNGDHVPDLATANLRTNDVSVLLGQGDGTFQEVQDDLGRPLRFATGQGPNGVMAADLNRDGYVDLATSNFNSNGVSVLMGLGNGKFRDAVTIATGPGPVNVNAADLNDDGHMDLVIPSGGSDDMTIFWGPWNGHFASQTQHGTGRGPQAVVAADFDGDGRLDLASANRTSNDVSVLLSKGDGSFRSAAAYGVGLQPSFIVTGDFNADGRIDIATANARSHDVSVLLGLGDGTFHRDPSDARQGETNPQGMVARDFNSDGRLDLAAVSYARGDLFVFLGRGDGSFQERARFAAGSTPVELVADDFNHDGHADLATVNCDSGDFSVLLGRGDGTFRDHVRYPSSASGEFAVTGDFNRDGHSDLVAGGQFSSGIAIILGDGDGKFGERHLFVMDESPADGVAGDFNEDGWLDLATTNYFSPDHNVSIHLGRRDWPGRFEAPLHFAVGESPLGIVTGDFDRDGHLDLINANLAFRNLSLLRGRGDGSFERQEPIILPTGALPDFLLTTHFNDDNNDTLVSDDDYLDVVVSNAGSNNVWVLLGRGDASFADPVSYRVGDGPTPRRGLEAGDFNGDGNRDLAIPQVISSDVAVLLGSGDGRFREPLRFAVGLGPVAQVAGDFSGDGRLDLASVNPTTNDVTVSLGVGDGTMRSPVSFAVGAAPVAVLQGDFNSDGRLDLATANYVSGDVSVLLGLGTGPFRDERRFVVGTNPTSLVAGDFDGDGRLDLAAANAGSNDVSVLLGRSDGTFQGQARFAVGDLPESLVTGDFDGDGRLDLATANHRSNDVTLLWGRGDGSFLASPRLPVGTAPIALLASDFNRDGRLDLATANYLSHDVSVLIGRGDRTFQNTVPYQAGTHPISVVSSDFNGDGRLDLAAGNSLSDDVSLLLGRGDGTFEDPRQHPVGDYPVALLAADFDDDARTDLAIATQLASDVSILQGLGDADATFVAAGTLSNPRHATPIVTDWNGDGIVDVAVLSRDGKILVRVARPGTPGVFDAPAALNPDPRFAARDLTVVSAPGGFLVAALDAKSPTLSLYSRAPNGGFTRSVGPSVPGTLPVDITSGDLNGDGHDDLVVAAAGSNEVFVYIQSAGNGAGQSRGFSRPSPDYTMRVGVSPSAVELTDVDGDQRLDILVANRFSGDISVLYNERGTTASSEICFCERRFRTGTGLYSLVDHDGSPTVRSRQAPAGLVAGQFDGDNLADLIVTNSGSNSFSVLRGSGSGGFLNPASATSFLTGIHPTVVVAGRFDDDPYLDLAILNEGSADLSIFLGNGQGSFSTPRPRAPQIATAVPASRPMPMRLSAGNSPTGLSLHDVNGDGKLDLLVGNEFGDLLALLGNGDGTFQPYQRAGQNIALVVADLNGDGQDDFVFANEALDRVSVQYSEPGRTFAQERSDGLLAPGAVSAGDLNRDGQPDLVVANSGANNVLVYLGTRDGLFGAPQSFFAGTNPAGITIQDLNGDQLDDLVVANEGSNDVTVLLGQGRSTDWTLTNGPRLRAGSGPVATSVQDVTGDSIPDILVSNSQSNDVFLLSGVGSGFFDDRNPFIRTVGSEPRSIIPVDSGVLTVNRGSNDLTFIPNFFTSPRFDIGSGGTSPVAAVADDFNADGLSDLMVAHNGDGIVSLLVGEPGGLALARSFFHSDVLHPTALAVSMQGDEIQVYVAEEGQESATLLTSFGIPVPSPGDGEPRLPLTEVFLVTGPGFAGALNILTTGDDDATLDGTPRRIVARVPLEGFTVLALASVLYNYGEWISFYDTKEATLPFGEGDRTAEAVEEEHELGPSTEMIRFMIGVDEALDRSLPAPALEVHEAAPGSVRSTSDQAMNEWLFAFLSEMKKADSGGTLALSHIPVVGHGLSVLGVLLRQSAHHVVDALLEVVGAWFEAAPEAGPVDSGEDENDLPSAEDSPDQSLREQAPMRESVEPVRPDSLEPPDPWLASLCLVGVIQQMFSSPRPKRRGAPRARFVDPQERNRHPCPIE